MTQTILAGRYIVAAEVDRTADGATVHQATDRQLERPVSITLVVGARGELLQRAGAVEHRHLLPVHDVGIHRGTQFLVSAHHEARDLFDAAGLIPVTDVPFVRSLVRQLAAALDALAAQRLVHLGVDPLAIRIGPSIHPADPGTVRLGRLHALLPEGSWGAVALAAPSFVAPEIEAGGPAGAAADRWSLAALAFTLLTGQPPYPTTESMTADEVAKVVEAKVAGDVAPVARLRPADRRAVPDAVDTVLRRGLSPDPALRPATATEFADALAEACEEVPVAPEPRTDHGGTGRRRRGPLLAAATVALVVVAGLLAWRVLGADEGGGDPAPSTAEAGLPEAFRFVRDPLAEGCGPVEDPADDAAAGAVDVVRCASSGTTDRVVLERFETAEDRDRAVAGLLDRRIDQLATCSSPPLVRDADRPAALACFTPPGGGAELVWSVGGRPVLATAVSEDGTTAALEVWLRLVGSRVIEEGR